MQGENSHAYLLTKLVSAEHSRRLAFSLVCLLAGRLSLPPDPSAAPLQIEKRYPALTES